MSLNSYDANLHVHLLGLPSFTEPDDPSKPVSLISQGGGHFKCSRCNVGFKDIAIPHPLGGGGGGGSDPSSTSSSDQALMGQNNNNSVVVKHCLNVHGTKAMLFRQAIELTMRVLHSPRKNKKVILMGFKSNSTVS